MREPPESHGPSGWQIAIILALIGAVATLGAAYLSSSDVNVFLSDDDSDGDNTTASTQVVTENQIAASDVAPTATFAPTATATNTPVPEPTSTPTATLVSTSTATPAPTPTSTPRPPTTTPMPPGTVLYEADESGGFADWELSGGWLLFQGMLVNDGGGGVLTVPFQPGTADYAVELEIQLVDRGGYNPFFRISMRGGAAQSSPRVSVLSSKSSSFVVSPPRRRAAGRLLPPSPAASCPGSAARSPTPRSAPSPRP